MFCVPIKRFGQAVPSLADLSRGLSAIFAFRTGGLGLGIKNPLENPKGFDRFWPTSRKLSLFRFRLKAEPFSSR
jgi:hypothetical protein